MKKALGIIGVLICLLAVPGLATEIVVDNPSAVLVGSWTTATSASDKYGADYLYTAVANPSTKSATYTPTIPTTGSWTVYVWYPTVTKQTTAAQYIIHHAGGDTVISIDQTANRGTWVSLGTFTLNAGTGNYVRVTNYGGSSRNVAADAIRFVSDADPPVISNVASNPSDYSAVITWTTDEPATSQVEYGLTAGYGSETAKDTNLVTSHSVSVTGLDHSTLYNFRVKSEDAALNLAVSGNYTFITTTPDTTPPVISAVSASPSVGSALITWTTDEPATSQVEYGLTDTYGSQTTKDTSLVTSHSVTVSGLTVMMLYHYRVKSDDAAGNPAVSVDYTFTTTSATPEWRAIWADTWNNGILGSSQITTAINTLSAANYNAIIPEVRKCGDAYYDSAYEPRATNIIDPPPFDPLADIITKAHAAGIEVHPWIVAYRIWNSAWSSPPPSHIWFQHPEWAMLNSAGSNLDGTYYDLDPGIPAVQDYICDVVIDIVSKYDIDGFNWDYIRYPSGYYWGYNQITKDRFNAEYGYMPPTSTADSNWATWADYRRRQVTDLVRKCYLEIIWRKPHVKMSVDVVGWSGGDPNTDFTATRAYKEVYQDAEGWQQQHLIDINLLMNYKREYDAAQAPDYRLWDTWLKTLQNTTGRHSADGQAAYLNAITDSITQMQVARTSGIGICNYSYASTNKDGQPASDFYNAVRNNIYTTPAPVPDMPWKSAPTTGIIFGTVTDASQPNDPVYQNWIYKATVQVTGPVTQSMETDATGTYGFLDLPPGTYTVSCSKTGFATRTYATQTILAGDILREDFDLGTVSISSPSSTINRAGKSLFSLPYEPVDPAPATVMGSIPIDGLLIQWDRPTQSSRAYDEWDPDFFGNMSLDQGYWLTVDSPRTINYQAYGGYAGSRDQSLPKAGWNIIGCPFPTEHKWADMRITNGTTTVSLEQARDNGWLNSVGIWWDSEYQSSRDVGLPDDYCFTDYLQPWHGHWLRTFVDNLTLTQR